MSNGFRTSSELLPAVTVSPELAWQRDGHRETPLAGLRFAAHFRGTRLVLMREGTTGAAKHGPADIVLQREGQVATRQLCHTRNLRLFKSSFRRGGAARVCAIRREEAES